jgi:hypothetical protein
MVMGREEDRKDREFVDVYDKIGNCLVCECVHQNQVTDRDLGTQRADGGRVVQRRVVEKEGMYA